MFAQVDTRVPHEVEQEVQKTYRRMFADADREFVPRVFEWVGACFSGGYGDYQPIDALYHDLEHTMQGTLCLTRLLHGRHRAGAQPGVDRHWFEMALLAILFHDTGYLKQREDKEGTGAKYTVIHVGRSADFAREFLALKGYSEEDQTSVANMISCTGVNADLKAIPFHGDLERTLGFALATADILGQMAARDYVEKLPILYLEFIEAAGWGGEKAARFARFRSATELAQRTPQFWQEYVLPKINNDFLGLYRFLSDPYPDGPNQYLLRVEQNLERIRRQTPPA